MESYTKTGFTLIELLVVVIIIGILAAVAYPQYQAAVEKSRTSEAITTLNAMTKAATVRFMESGDSWIAGRVENHDVYSQLDIGIPLAKGTRLCSKNFLYAVDCNPWLTPKGCYFTAYRVDNHGTDATCTPASMERKLYDIQFIIDSKGNLTRKCGHKVGEYTPNTSPALANKVCKSLGEQGFVVVE